MYNIKIALTGAQSTGKSTVIQGLRNSDFEFHFIDSPTRDIETGGHGINENGDDETQLMITSNHIKKFALSQGISFFDRCALDGLVYTTYLWKQKKVSDYVLELAIATCRNLIKQYDAVLYFPPEIDIIDDGIRSIDVGFRDDVVDIFESYLNDYRIPHAKITGTVKERVQKVLMIVDRIKKAKDEEDAIFDMLDERLQDQLDKIKEEK